MHRLQKDKDMEKNAHYIMKIHYVINTPLSFLCIHQHEITNLDDWRQKKPDTASRVIFPLISRSFRLAFVNIKQDIRIQLTEFAQPIKYHRQFLICPNHLPEK